MDSYYNENVTRKLKFIDLEKKGIDIHRVIYDLTANSGINYQNEHIFEYLFLYIKKHKILPRNLEEFKSGYYKLPDIPDDYYPEHIEGLISYLRENYSTSQNLSYKRDFYFNISPEVLSSIILTYKNGGNFEDTLVYDLPYVVLFMIWLSIERKDGYFFDMCMIMAENNQIS